MELERLEDLSLYYFLQEKFSAFSFVKVVDGFPENTALTTPTISIEWDNTKGYKHELGNRKLLRERLWYIDVFAKNKSQRDDFIHKIFNDLQAGVPVYDYNQGFPPNIIPQLNTMEVIELEMRNLHNMLEDDTQPEVMQYRAVVLLTASPVKF